MKNEQNDICPKNTFSPNFVAIPGSKAESDRTRPQHTGAIVLNKPFVRLRTLLYSISLDA